LRSSRPGGAADLTGRAAQAPAADQRSIFPLA